MGRSRSSISKARSYKEIGEFWDTLVNVVVHKKTEVKYVANNISLYPSVGVARRHARVDDAGSAEPV